MSAATLSPSELNFPGRSRTLARPSVRCRLFAGSVPTSLSGLEGEREEIERPSWRRWASALILGALDFSGSSDDRKDFSMSLQSLLGDE